MDTLTTSLRLLARDIDSQDGVANAVILQAADEIERLRNQRNHWMAAARAFDEHLATMRVMFMEHPTIRFGVEEERL